MKIEKIVVASHNQGKIKEIGEMLKPLNIAVVPAAELELPDVEETGTTFEENARLKADAFSKLCGLPCLADDSGLCVDALGDVRASIRHVMRRTGILTREWKCCSASWPQQPTKRVRRIFPACWLLLFRAWKPKFSKAGSTAGLQPKNTETAVSAMIPCLYPTRATAGVSGSSAKRKKRDFAPGQSL